MAAIGPGISPKNDLQQYSQKWGLALPNYVSTTLISDETNSHKFQTVVTMTFPNNETNEETSDLCNTKKASQQDAATKMIAKVEAWLNRQSSSHPTTTSGVEAHETVTNDIVDLFDNISIRKTIVFIDLENIPNLVDLVGVKKDNLIIEGYANRSHPLATGPYKEHIRIVQSLQPNASDLSITMDAGFYHMHGYHIIVASKDRFATTLCDLLERATQVVSREELLIKLKM